MSFTIRLIRRIALGVFVLSMTGCCCCDPEALQQFTEAAGMQEEIEAQIQEEMAKAEAQAAEQQAKMAEQQAAVQVEAQEMEVEVAEKAAPKPVPAAPVANVGGKFKDMRLEKKALTGGSLKLEVDAKTKKITGRFLGQYHRKPFSIPVEGKLSATNAFTLTGKHEDSDISVKGAHEGDVLTGNVTGKVRSKPIAAKFDAKRYK